jgi:phosphatidylserine/phosphatidylglycerophosphate/cardiolipin synthase-like enzyme
VLALGSLLALPLCLSRSWGASPIPVIHYAPVENLEQADVALIDRAEHDIDIAAYVLTDRPVMSALLRAAGRGVKIRIYLDGGRIGEREPTPLFRELLATPEIDVRFKREITFDAPQVLPNRWPMATHGCRELFRVGIEAAR